MKNLDQFIEYLYLVEENVTELTTHQIQKLEVIKDKVTEIVKKVEDCAAQLNPCKTEVQQPSHVRVKELELAIRENQVHSFGEFTELNEKISKRGDKFVVTDKSGKKVLGTHSSRKKAVKQLQAIEISKAKHAR